MTVLIKQTREIPERMILSEWRWKKVQKQTRGLSL
jgi:hypothetical protein